VAPAVLALAWLGIALLIRSFRLKRRVHLRRRKLKLRRKMHKESRANQENGSVSATD
jgi:cardiolipin synthase